MISTRLDRFDEIAGTLIECAASPRDWAVVLERLCSYFHGSRSCFSVFGPDGALLLNATNITDEAFLPEAMALGPDFAPPICFALAERQGGFAYKQSDLLTPDANRQSPVWQKVMRPRDMFDGVGYKMELAGTGWGMFDVQRGRRQGAFDDRQRDLFGAFGMVFSRCASVMLKSHRLQTELDRTRSLLDTMPTGVALISTELRIFEINPFAAECLRDCGFALEGSQLVARTAAARRIAEKIARLRTAPETMPLYHQAEWDGQTISLTVEHAAVGMLKMSLIRRAKYDPGAATQILAGIFDLTRREAELAAWIADGYSLVDISDLRGRSLSTLRAQLQQLFQKCNASRQAELAIKLRLALPR